MTCLQINFVWNGTISRCLECRVVHYRVSQSFAFDSTQPSSSLAIAFPRHGQVAYGAAPRCSGCLPGHRRHRLLLHHRGYNSRSLRLNFGCVAEAISWNWMRRRILFFWKTMVENNCSGGIDFNATFRVSWDETIARSRGKQLHTPVWYFLQRSRAREGSFEKDGYSFWDMYGEPKHKRDQKENSEKSKS